MSTVKPRNYFIIYSGRVAVVGVLGLLATWLLPLSNAEKLGAVVGAALSVVSGFVGLWMKRRMLQEGIEGALRAVGVVFGLRLMLVAAGLVWAVRRGAGETGFVLAFFLMYFVLQWLEISYVLAEQKQRQ